MYVHVAASDKIIGCIHELMEDVKERFKWGGEAVVHAGAVYGRETECGLVGEEEF